MKKADILEAIKEFMINSNVDPESVVWKNAMDAFIAISINKIEE